MQEDIASLKEKFLKIKEKGWIKSKRKGPTGIGYTFEDALNKSEENFPVPDFNSIEIKTMHKYSRRVIHLFNSTPDGDFLFPIKRILEILGYPDRENKEYKVLNININAIEYTKIGYYKNVKLVVNRKEQKIEILALNHKGLNLNVNISWSFELLRERLNLKLKYLAVIEADSKTIGNDEYFYYNRIKFYKLRDFDTFISLIDKGIITITFKIGVFKSGKRTGQIHDRGTDFSIKEEDLEKLYTRIR